MNHAENLITILKLLNNQWGNLTSYLTSEELLNLKIKFSELENNMKLTNEINKINEISKKFIQSISKIETLEFLNNVENVEMRKGTLPGAGEDIRIKILNYTVDIQDKITINIEEKRLKNNSINLID